MSVGYQTIEVPTFADLRSRDLYSFFSQTKQFAPTQVKLLGYYAPGDAGGNRRFAWSPASTAADNGGTIAQLGYGSTSPIVTGRLVQQNENPAVVKVAWFGYRSGNSTYATANGVAAMAAYSALPVSAIFTAGLISPYTAGYDAAPLAQRFDLVARAGEIQYPGGWGWVDRTIYCNAGVAMTNDGSQPYRQAGPLIRMTNSIIDAANGAYNVYRRALTLSAVKLNWGVTFLQAFNSNTNDNFFPQFTSLGINGGGETEDRHGTGAGGLLVEAWAQGASFSKLDLSDLESYIALLGVGTGCADVKMINILGPIDRGRRTPAFSVMNPNGLVIDNMVIVGHNSTPGLTSAFDGVSGDGANDPAAAVHVYAGAQYSGIEIRNLQVEHCAQALHVGHDNGSGVASSSLVGSVKARIVGSTGCQRGGVAVVTCTGNGVAMTIGFGTATHLFLVGQKVTCNNKPTVGAPAAGTRMTGNTALNGVVGTVTAIADHSVTITTIGNGVYAGGGTVESAQHTNPFVRVQGNVGGQNIDLNPEGKEGNGAILPAYSSSGESYFLSDTTYPANPLVGSVPRTVKIPYSPSPGVVNTYHHTDTSHGVWYWWNQTIQARYGALVERLDFCRRLETVEPSDHSLIVAAATAYEIANFPVNIGTQAALGSVHFQYSATTADGTTGSDGGFVFVNIKPANLVAPFDVVKCNSGDGVVGSALITFSAAIVDAAGNPAVVTDAGSRISIRAASTTINTSIHGIITVFARIG